MSFMLFQIRLLTMLLIPFLINISDFERVIFMNDLREMIEEFKNRYINMPGETNLIYGDNYQIAKIFDEITTRIEAIEQGQKNG